MALTQVPVGMLSSDLQTATYSMKNRLINGDMRIDQRGGGNTFTWSNLQTTTYTVDRWAYYCDVINLLSCQQSTVAPPGFKNSMLFTSLTAANQTQKQWWWAQPIEGYNIADLAWGTASAQPVTISFWVKSSLAGTFGGSIQDNNAGYSFCWSYTIAAGEVGNWKYVSITVPGPTFGTWGTGNGVGLAFRFEFNGQGYNAGTGTPNTWSTGNNTGPVGATKFIGTNGATMYITGVQLEKGSTATAFDYRDYGREMIMCQRYYEMQRYYWRCGLASYFYHNRPYIVQKRAAATVTNSNVTNSDGSTNYGVYSVDVSAYGINHYPGGGGAGGYATDIQANAEL